MTRAFLAVQLPPAAVETAAHITRRLRETCGTSDVKWVAPGNLHLTLRFFGDLDDGMLVRARDLVRSRQGAFEPCRSGWVGLGAFPSARRPQVIWLGLADEGGHLKAFAADMNRRLVRAGFGRADKPFKAHVTLGRVRRGRSLDWSAASEGLTIPGEGFSIASVALIKSRLTPQGPVYTPLETAHAQMADPSSGRD